jgi:glycosyltransferase involved in cell wall biosynthesis
MSNSGAKVLQPFVPEVRAAAARAFADEHPGLRFAPAVALIAAFDEEEGLGPVLEGIPAQVDGLRVDTLVIDDGSSDRTAEVARAHGAYLVRLERNCGHGVALRLGYELARVHGARYIVTLDGDGQWDPHDVPMMLAPLISDQADFVLGSRVLGSTETDDRFRQLGVHVFARLVSLLTGTRVTDTSTGLRAMRVEVPATVRQEQVQYQTSELLIGAILQGYRVTERPIVMHKRSAGESKKGNDLLYGARYAGVVLRTWWRERRGPHAAGAPGG